MTATSTLDAQIPELIRQLENALRGGYNLIQAFGIVERDMSAPMCDEAGHLITDLRGGVPFRDACTNWVSRVGSSDLDLVIACLKVQIDVGGNLADKLNLLGQIMAQRTLVKQA